EEHDAVKSTHIPLPHSQQGAALFIALIMLLIITLLAVSSMREVSLEARITGNLLEQKRLTAAAEAGLREGEKRIALTLRPLEECGSKPCVHGFADDYESDFSAAEAYTGLDDATTLPRNTYWYLRNVRAGGPDSEAEDPEYGNYARGIGNFYYEINSQAHNIGSGDSVQPQACGAGVNCLRSVVVRVYND